MGMRRRRRRAGVAVAALAVAGLSWSGRGVFGFGAVAPPAPVLRTVASAARDGLLHLRVPVPLVLRVDRAPGNLPGPRSLANSSLVGVADVLGTGKADLVVQTGDELQVLDADTGVTILSVGLPAQTVVLGLAPAAGAGAGARAAGVVLLSPDVGPLRSDDRVTVLAGPVLAPVWTRDVPETQQN